jgi:hypothetical protein
LKTNKGSVHRGAILHAVARRSIKTITQIASDANYEKSSFYVHIKKEDLELDILYKYGVAIPHDFSFEIPEMAEYMELHGIKKPDEKKLTYEELYQQMEKWRDKYFTLLEEHNSLLKEQFK